MKVVILAGGFGTRISEESVLKPKPMVGIGERPIIWHIMKEYSARGFNEFIVCLGYKGYIIKEYFSDYFLHTSDVTFDLKKNEMTVHKVKSEPWKVTLIDTGINTATGGRLKRIKNYLGNKTFMMTYGDGLSDVDMNKVLEFHKEKGKLLTITAVKASQRFGIIDLDKEGIVKDFREKNKFDDALINGGYMVLEPGVLDYIEGDDTFFEQKPLENLARDGQIAAYVHNGFWKCMDMLRDKKELEKMWEMPNPPWKVWKD